MDLNCLLHRHQVSLMRADAAASDANRREHRDVARGYAGLIGELRRSTGAIGAAVRA